MKEERIIHPIDPVFDKDCRILILGSFPSVKSREEGFFYGHPQNRFWKVLSQIYEDEEPEDIDSKKSFLLKHHIALWDVIGECDIRGSSDSSITNVVINDLDRILKHCDIGKIYVNGKTAEKYYLRYGKNVFQRDVIVLPSTSPANAAMSLQDLVKAWTRIKTGR